MDVRPIRTDEDHAAALRRIDVLWGAPLDSPEGDELDVLVDLVVAYERRYHGIEPGDDLGATIRAAMEERHGGLAELVSLVGTEERARAVLEGRDLTLPVVRWLHERWSIPADLLLRGSASREAA